MPDVSEFEKLGVLLVRAMGLFLLVVGVWLLVSGLIQSWGRESLVYWGSYLRAEVLPPSLLVLAGVGLLLFARPLGRACLARGLGTSAGR